MKRILIIPFIFICSFSFSQTIKIKQVDGLTDSIAAKVNSIYKRNDSIFYKTAGTEHFAFKDSSNKWVAGASGFLYYNGGNVAVGTTVDDGHKFRVNGTVSFGGSDGSLYYNDADGTFTEVPSPIGMIKPVLTHRNGFPQWIEDSTAAGTGVSSWDTDIATLSDFPGPFLKLQSAVPTTAQTGGFRVTGDGVIQDHLKVGNNYTANAFDVEINKDAAAANILMQNNSTTASSEFYATSGSLAARFGTYPSGYSTAGMQEAGKGVMMIVNGGYNAGTYTAHPFQFWTNDTLRGQFNSGGKFLLESLKTGNTAPTITGTKKMVVTDSIGQLSFDNIPSGGGGGLTDGDYGDITVSGTGTVMTADADAVIKNQTASAQTGGFRVSGNGIVQGQLKVGNNYGANTFAAEFNQDAAASNIAVVNNDATSSSSVYIGPSPLTTSLRFGYYGSSFSSSGMEEAGKGNLMMVNGNGLNLGTYTSAPLQFWTNNTLRGQFSSTGELSLSASNYINWGTTFGSTGYGIRDNAGTIEFKNSGGSWAGIGSGGGTPAGNTGNIQINRGGAFATPASDSLYYNTADGLHVSNDLETTTNMHLKPSGYSQSTAAITNTNSGGSPAQLTGTLQLKTTDNTTTGTMNIYPIPAGASTVKTLNLEWPSGSLDTIANRAWVRSLGSGGGETNTASNQNATGVGVFYQKSGVDLQFKGIHNASSAISVADNTTDHVIDLDVNQSNLSLSSIGGLLTTSQINGSIGTTPLHLTGAPSNNGTLWATSTGSQSAIWADNTSTGHALTAISSSGSNEPLFLERNGSATNDVQPVIRTWRTGGTTAAGFGSAIVHELEVADGSIATASQLETKWTTATAGAEVSNYDIKLKNAGTLTSAMNIRPDGFILGGSAATSGKILKSDGTKFLASTETYAAPGTSGNIMQSDGTNWTSAANNGGYSKVTVASDVSNATTTMADITGLITPTLTNAATYEVDILLDVSSSSTAGATFQIVLGGSGSGSFVALKVQGTGLTTSADITASATPTASMVTINGEGVVLIKGIFKTLSAGTATFKIQQAKTTSGTVITRANSYIKYKLL